MRNEECLSAVVLLEEVHLEGDVVDHADLVLGIDVHLDVLVVGQLRAHSLQHAKRHGVLVHSVEGSTMVMTRERESPGGEHEIVHLHQNAGMGVVDLSRALSKLGVRIVSRERLCCSRAR